MLSSNLQELLERRSNWSLAEDRQLCGALEEISSSLSSKMNSVSDAIQENFLKISNTCVGVSNLNNQLSLFAADQFIESRVGDDTSFNAKPISTSQMISSNKQVGATDNLREAVSMGLELMRTRFKRIDLRPEDLDEEDDPTCLPEPIFEPYDENLSRPLPLLIGSSDWLSSSFATSSDKCTETAKVTEEVVVSLPPFAQPRMAEYITSSHSDSLNERPANVILGRKTSDTLSNKDFGVKVDDYANKRDTKSYAPQEIVATSSSQHSLLKGEIGNAKDITSDSTRNKPSLLSSEVSIIHRNSAVPVEHPDYEAIPKPSDLEASARYLESGISFKRNLTEAVEDESKVKGSSNSVDKLFVDSSSDEDDLFSDLKNTGKKAKRRIVPTYSNDSQIVLFPESKKTDLQITGTDVHSSALMTDVLRPKSPLIAADDVTLNGTENAEISDTFRNKLDSILSNKIITNTISSVEERQVEENAVGNGGTSATLSSLAKLRAKGPPRRSPSRLLQQPSKKDDKDEVKSVSTSVMSRSTEGDRIIKEQTDTCEGQRDLQLRIDSRKHIPENVNNMKQRNDINSIFSSDSDDDIFSTFSSKPKRGENVSKPKIPHVGKEEARSSLSFRERSLITSCSRAQTFKTSSELRNLFDSDDEDLFTSSISIVKKQQNQAARDTKSGNGKVIQEIVTPKKNGPVWEKRETVAPIQKQSNSKPKRIDIFSDDSDEDLFK